MSDYRAYLIGPTAISFKSVVVDEPDDAAAIASAKQLVDGHDVSYGSETGKSQNLSKSKNNSEQFRRSFVLN